MRRRAAGLMIVVELVATATSARTQLEEAPRILEFFLAASLDGQEAAFALDQIEARWKDGYAHLLVDLLRVIRPPSTVDIPSDLDFLRDDEGAAALPSAYRPSFQTTRPARQPSDVVRARLVSFLERQTGQRFGDDPDEWRRWLWRRPDDPHPDYAAFKGQLYGQTDPRMRRLLGSGTKTTVRLDEVEWGGVGVNAMPPLDHPATVPARDASYLKGGHVVFGVVVNGQARAYPRRILAWHDVVRDSLGGVEMTVASSMPGGIVVPYESECLGELRHFGSSGLLYRSSGLLFDEESESLWSVANGRPIIGPLAGSDAELVAHPVVTTTWAEWRAAHPETTVLSLETGHDRSYDERAASRLYRRGREPLFPVSETDTRLNSKAQVLAMRLPDVRAGKRAVVPVAVPADRLERQSVWTLEQAGRTLVLVTSKEGAARVYESGEVSFTRALDAGWALADGDGHRWRVTEAALIGPGSGGKLHLARVPAWRVFWFAWYAHFPDTRVLAPDP